jgi:hypothetical protein
MFKKLVMFTLLFLFSLFLSINYSYALTYIDSCQELNVSNETYVLTQDLIDISCDSNCFHITADNITLDCDGHIVDGFYDNEQNVYYCYNAVIIENYVRDTIIKNCNFNEFNTIVNCYKCNFPFYGIGGRYTKLENINASNSFTGFNFDTSYNVSIHNSNFYNITDTCISIYGNDNYNISDVYGIECEYYGLYLNVDKANISNLHIENSNYGIFSDSSTNVNMKKIKLKNNRFGFYSNYMSSNFIIEDAQIYNSTDYEYYLEGFDDTNLIINADFLDYRKIYFADEYSVFTYKDKDSSIVIKTKPSEYGKTLQRKIVSISKDKLMIYDKSDENIAFNYTIYNLYPNTKYVIKDNTGEKEYITDSSGLLTYEGQIGILEQLISILKSLKISLPPIMLTFIIISLSIMVLSPLILLITFSGELSFEEFITRLVIVFVALLIIATAFTMF